MIMKNTKRLFILFPIAFIIIFVGIISILANKKTAELQCPTPEQFSGIVAEAELSQWIMEDSGTELEGDIKAAYSKAWRYELYDREQKFHCQFLSYVSQAGTPGIVITFLPIDSSVITEKEYIQLLNKGIPELWVLSSKLCSNSKIIFDLQEQMETAYEKVTAPEQYIDRISYFSEWGAQSSGIYATARMIKQGADDCQMWYQIKLASEAEYNDTSSWEKRELSEVQTLKKNSSMELSNEDMGKGTEKYYFLKGKLSQIEETEEFEFSFSPSSANLPANTYFYQKAILTDASGSLLVYIAPTALSKKELGGMRLHILQKVQNRDKDVCYIVVKSCLTECSSSSGRTFKTWRMSSPDYLDDLPSGICFPDPDCFCK